SVFALGSLHEQQGDLPRAYDRLRQAVTLLDDLVAKDPDDRSLPLRLANAHEKLGDVHSHGRNNYLYDLKKAAASYREARKLLDELHRLDPENAEYQERWSHVTECVGFTLMKQGQSEGKKHLEEALDRAEKLVADDPANFSRRSLRHRCALALS